jgi:sugar O-acyltransferase (sialic acid O-acetyltransferase NeuD family)
LGCISLCTRVPRRHLATNQPLSHAGILWTRGDTTGQRNLDRTQEVASSSLASSTFRIACWTVILVGSVVAAGTASSATGANSGKVVLVPWLDCIFFAPGMSANWRRREVYIAGTGTMADDVAEYATAAGLTVVGRIELVDRRRIGGLVGSVPVISPDSRPPSERPARAAIALAGDRIAFARVLRSHGWALESIVHPRAEVSPSAELGEGVIIGPMSVLGAGARLAPLVQVGRGALVGHHVELGEGAVLHPGVNIGGRACIGAGATVAIGAVVVSGTRIGAGALVAAGAVVVRDVEDGKRVQGVPARVFDGPGGEHQ